jgi:hypothetical protein
MDFHGFSRDTNDPGLAHLYVFCKGGYSCSLRQDFPPVAADFIAPTFTKNVKVGQPPSEF